ncbi:MULTISPECIES: monovalent cation/H(+) antiporter subunit G [Alkalimonas]|uniref:Monovalent cation/H(+) antiporter subunit G n=1 Tax=Alkalimonas mucilaginosa TaxID=3057676 RepID=A0ABU7JCD0_9GAMM|nr:monovalent cation/H(+) antiporter subunit G [Alkalimonas sp. MEB004]MEE2023344.1 monovalent cation/H(+) antiporter subunit G [Alkalimonas sp. MEB004]
MMAWLGAVLLILGLLFFLAGSLGVLRFPDVFCRLHAVTKADTLGLGFIVLGLGVLQQDWQRFLLMLLIWGLVMLSGTISCQLLGQYGREQTTDQEEPAE